MPSEISKQPPVPSANILIVDDNGELRDLLVDVLTSRGHDVAVAKDGVQALILLDSCQPDIVVTDIFMPEKDGFEVIMEVRRRNPQLPILAISGAHAMRNVNFLSMAPDFGANRVISKPFRLSHFVGIVEDMLAGSQFSPS